MADINVKKETIKSTKWSATGQYTNTLVGFLIGVVLARLLTPSDYGIVGMISIFFAIAGIITDSGFGLALIRKQDATDQDFSTVFYFNFAVSFLCYIILFICSPLIADFFSQPILKSLVRISALSLVIGSLGSIQYTILTKNLNFKRPAVISIVSNVLSGCIGIGYAYFGYGVWALVAQSLSKTIISVISVWFLTSWHPKLIFSLKSFRELFKVGSNLLVSRILASVYGHFIPLLIGKFYAPAALGYYSKGQRISLLPNTAIYGVVGSVTMPILSKIQDDDERLINVYNKYIKVFSLIIFFVMFLLAAMAKPLVILIYSEKWLPSAAYISVFCLGYMFSHISQLNLNLLMVKGRTDLNLKIEVWKKIIWTCGLLIALPISVMAVCVMTAILVQASLLINTYYTKKLMGFGYIEQWKVFLPYLIIAGLCSIPAFTITFINVHYIFQILIGVTLSSALYFGFLYIRKDENLIDLINITPLKKYIHLK